MPDVFRLFFLEILDVNDPISSLILPRVFRLLFLLLDVSDASIPILALVSSLILPEFMGSSFNWLDANILVLILISSLLLSEFFRLLFLRVLDLSLLLGLFRLFI